MSELCQEVESWSRVRWGVSIAGVVILQFVLLLALSNGSTKRMQRDPSTHVILPQKLTNEFQALTDPTLFAMGSPHGFSSIWMEPTNLPPLDANWEQDPQWLPIEPLNLGAGFIKFARSNAATLHGLTFKIAPQQLPSPADVPVAPLRTASTLRITGDLAKRKLLRVPTLPAQSASDLLASSEVRVVVDSRGIVTSAILLPPGSGSAEADRYALDQAWRTRFVPTSTQCAAKPLTMGGLVFEWQTVPPTPTSDDAHE